MTRAEAHALLDAAKSGACIGREVIVSALRMTGDICCDDDIDDVVIQYLRPVGTWELRRDARALLRPAHAFDGLLT